LFCTATGQKFSVIEKSYKNKTWWNINSIPADVHDEVLLYSCMLLVVGLLTRSRISFYWKATT